MYKICVSWQPIPAKCPNSDNPFKPVADIQGRVSPANFSAELAPHSRNNWITNLDGRILADNGVKRPGMTKYRVDHVNRVDHIITASAAPGMLKRPN